MSEGTKEGLCAAYDGDLRCRHVVPLGDKTFLHVLYALSIRVCRLFLEMADETMSGPRRKQIRQEEHVEKDSLCAEYHGTEEDRGLLDGHEGAG
jgi:hypothetical protein